MFKIAFRNVLRNGRRSLMTALSIIVGATALILLGEYNGTIKVGMETGIVRGIGHLSVFKTGGFDAGSSRPGLYSIEKFEHVLEVIRNDPELKSLITVATPRVTLGGIAGNSAVDKSKTFFATGLIPSDKDKMNHWDGYGIAGSNRPDSGMSDSDTHHGIVGVGLARILGLCAQVKLKGCPDNAKAPAGKAPELQLLSGAGGAPNIVTMAVSEARGQGAKEADDSYITMHLNLAQQLLYGGGEHKVTTIVVQLKQPGDLPRAKARLKALFAVNHLDLEVRDFNEVYPMLRQIQGYFMAMYAFIGVVMIIIVMFTIANTMSMSVMERTNEIGTARAMGVRRGGIHRQFLLEGALLGALGASLGVVLGIVASYVVNQAGITYTPPGNASSVSLFLVTKGNEALLAGIWLTLLVISTLASLVPANRAAKMKVVDALRHV